MATLRCRCVDVSARATYSIHKLKKKEKKSKLPKREKARTVKKRILPCTCTPPPLPTRGKRNFIPLGTYYLPYQDRARVNNFFSYLGHQKPCDISLLFHFLFFPMKGCRENNCFVRNFLLPLQKPNDKNNACTWMDTPQI